jgi:hypothetical protein
MDHRLLIADCSLRSTFHEMPRLRFRLILGWCALSLLGAGIGLGAGNYQPTKDGKTFVWNGNPRPGETATWEGDRDKEGYAAGFGSLTWYTARGNVFALYYGNMVHGKFEGLVNVHSKGKTGHAMFVDGERNSPWATGPAPSRPEAGLAIRSRTGSENKPPAKPEVSRQKPEVTSVTAEAATKPAKKTEIETIKRAPAIAEKKAEPGSVEDELRRTEPVREPEVRATPALGRQSTDAGSFEPTPIPKVQAAPALDRQITESSQPPSPETETVPKPSATEIPNEFATQPTTTPKAESVEQSAVATEQVSPMDGHLASNAQPSSPEPSPSATEQRADDGSQQSQMQSSNPAPTKQSPSDVSVNALTGPPSSLRTGPRTVETPPESTPQPETKSSPPPERGEAQLRESDAISAADAEVRAAGGDPDQYQRPTVDYSSVTDKWTLFYATKNASLSNGPRSFTATVEDKTKKVEFKK